MTTESQWPHPTAALLRCRDQPLRGVTGCTGAPCPYRPHPAPLPSRERERERPFTSRPSSAGAYNGRGYKRHGSRVICFLAGGTFDDRRRDRGAADRSVHRPGTQLHIAWLGRTPHICGGRRDFRWMARKPARRDPEHTWPYVRSHAEPATAPGAKRSRPPPKTVHFRVRPEKAGVFSRS